MPAYIGGPPWPAVDDALRRGDFPAAMRAAEPASNIDDDERNLIVGICHAIFHESEQSTKALGASLRGFLPDRPCRAAVAAVFLGRLHHFVHGQASVANGSFARARTLIADRGDCLEAAVVALPLPGCDRPNITELHHDAAMTLALAHRLHDSNIHAKALADLGTAEVTLGTVDTGLAHLDEALAMVAGGDVDSPFVTFDIVCNLLSACARCGDLRRAEEWTTALELHLGLAVDNGPPFLYAHCRTPLGRIRCDVGRWQQAEAVLTVAATRATGARVASQVHTALAELRILQGRLGDAERLLDRRGDFVDTGHALAALHLARGDAVQAADAARNALRCAVGDHLRSARLLGVLVDAELAQGNHDNARDAAERLAALAEDQPLPALRARAHLVEGHVAEASENPTTAGVAYERGLAALATLDWPQLRAELHLGLSRALADRDRATAIAEARTAHALLADLGSPQVEQAARQIARLGEPAAVRGRPPLLTRRELEVLRELRHGSSNAEIAAKHHNSVRTIEHHVSSILDKLGLRNRAEAAAYAARRCPGEERLDAPPAW